MCQRDRPDGESELPSFKHLIARYSPWLLRLASQRGIAVEDSEEIVADVFLQLFRQMVDHGPESIRKLKPWLAKVFQSKTADFFLRAHR